jgi:hypothetical protein
LVERVFVTRVEIPADAVNGDFGQCPGKGKAAPEGGFECAGEDLNLHGR